MYASRTPARVPAALRAERAADPQTRTAAPHSPVGRAAPRRRTRLSSVHRLLEALRGRAAAPRCTQTCCPCGGVRRAGCGGESRPGGGAQTREDERDKRMGGTKDLRGINDVSYRRS